MDSRQQSSPQNKRALLRLWGICVVTCLALVSTANAQLYAPMTGGGMPGSIYADPNTSTLYSPAGPQATFGPAEGYQAGMMGQDMMGQDMGMLSQNGMVQPGELSSLNYSQSLGEYGGVQMYGDPNGEGGIGASYHANPATWAHVRDLQLGVYTNEEQTVINGGSTFEFYVDDHFGFGGRVLLGGANNDVFTDEFHFSGDLYMGTTRLDQHWIKGGVIYDVQDDFHKVGPAVGFLMFADRRHPINLDFAYGIGYGAPILDPINSTLTAVADDDAQLRVGTYVTPNLQAGFSGNWVNFADGVFQDYNGYGGFINLNLGTLSINVDYTTGDHRDRGFVNIAYTFGGRRSRAADGCDMAFVEHPRDWLGKPVMRDVSLQTQQVRVALPPGTPGAPGTPGGPPGTNTGVGNLTQVNFRLDVLDLSGGFPAGGDGDGILEANEIFAVLVQVVNGTTQNATGVTVSNVVVTPISAATISIGTTSLGTIPAGSSTTTSLGGLGLGNSARVSSTASTGDQFFVDFVVTSDGQSRTYRSGPFTVGSSTDSLSFMSAIPLN